MRDASLMDPPWYRLLYERIMEYEGGALHADILDPWLDEHGSATAAWFESLAARPSVPTPPVEDWELWYLYAFSRVNDLLLLGFQPYRPHPDAFHTEYIFQIEPEFRVTPGEYVDFVQRCGLQVLPPEPFTPFLHEIVTVEQLLDPEAPIAILTEYWPAVMAGELLISRAGTGIAAGAKHATKGIADSSTLYWAFRRQYREYTDLSHGWGSNSQWRTNFRRDYRTADKIYLNVDGSYEATEPRHEDEGDGLNPRERLELLTHRCLVTTTKPSADLWPYYDRWTMQRSS